MFRTGSPYSPFFTSGLLNVQPTPDYHSFLSLDSQSLRPKLHIRRSRESMRTIPSPKPAPSTTLPQVPNVPRLPSIPIYSSPHRLPSSIPIDSSSHRNSTSSVVSPTIRKINRSHALARLEGRTNSTRPKSKPIKRNFMSMSDEESEGDLDNLHDFQNDPQRFALSVINEPEDLVLPSLLPLSPSDPRISPSFLPSRSKSTSSRNRQSTTKDWFSLKSFIDLQAADDDPTKFSWRSFIEVARVS